MRQIIALGGGGFSMEPDNPLLDLYILEQAKKVNPQICIIPTASGDSDSYISRYYNFLTNKIVNHPIYHYLHLRQGIWRALF